MKLFVAMGSISGPNIELFQSCNVKHVLISYADVGGKENLDIPFEEVMLDSGAFSVETGKEKVSLDSYILWLQLYLKKYPQIKTYINLDDLSDPYKSLENLLKMESEGLHPMPVYHYGEPEELLDFMCTIYEYVGLGGMAVGTMSVKNTRLFWEYVHIKYPNTKFHIFGVGTLTPFFRYQPYSIDSTSWNVGQIYGDIMCYKNGIPYRFSAREMYGYKMFFTDRELSLNNLRAQVDWEKCEWLKNIKLDAEQPRLQ